MRDLCVDLIRSYGADRGGYVLDIGCGTGELTRALSRFGTVIGADRSDDALRFCRRRDIPRLVRTSAETCGFKDNTFSLAVAFCLIEHLEDDGEFLRELHRILDTNGRIVILTSAFRFLWSDHDRRAHHKRRYTAGALKTMMEEKGFRIRKLSYVNSTLFPAVAILRLIQRLGKIKFKEEETFSLDIIKTPRLVQTLLYGILTTETRLLRHMSFPFGVGLVCVGEKI